MGAFHVDLPEGEARGRRACNDQAERMPALFLDTGRATNRPGFALDRIEQKGNNTLPNRGQTEHIANQVFPQIAHCQRAQRG
jgi:hypothetical protein